MHEHRGTLRRTRKKQTFQLVWNWEQGFAWGGKWWRQKEAEAKGSEGGDEGFGSDPDTETRKSSSRWPSPRYRSSQLSKIRH